MVFSSKGNLSTSFIPICGQVGKEFTQWWWWRASCCMLFRSGFDWNELEGNCQSHYLKGISPNKQVTKSSFQDFLRVSNHHGVLIAAKMKPAFFLGWTCADSTHVQERNQERKQQTICAMARIFRPVGNGDFNWFSVTWQDGYPNKDFFKHINYRQ